VSTPPTFHFAEAKIKTRKRGTTKDSINLENGGSLSRKGDKFKFVDGRFNK